MRSRLPVAVLLAFLLAGAGPRATSSPGPTPEGPVPAGAGGAPPGSAAASAPGPALAGAPPVLALLARLLARLEADPTTDWRRVDLEAARQHLADLDRVTLLARVAAEELPGGVALRVSGEDPATVAAIRRLLPERAARLAEARRWRVATAPAEDGLRVEIKSLDPREAGRIRALGLAALLVAGPLDEAYLLEVARGGPPPGRGLR